MGLSSKNCSIYPEKSIVNAPNPNPVNFKIITILQIGNNVVAQIIYPDCTNFEGLKICVFKDIMVKDIMCKKTLDPHFAEHEISPFARFEPTNVGWNTAQLLAAII